MPIQAFIDESGSKNQDAAFVLAGVIAESESWADFSDDWQSVLSASPSIEYFKMYEAAKLKGQFGGWKATERDGKMRQLAGVLNKHCSDAISVVLDINAFYEVIAPNMPKPSNNPYFVAFHQMVAAVGYHLLDRGQKEKFEIIFDENMIFGPNAKRWYPLSRDVALPELFHILPPEPMFKNDHDFLPLQAADMFAWLLRRSWNGQRQDFGWIIDEIPNVRSSEHVQIVDRARMERMLKRSEEIPSPEAIAKWKEIMGED